MGTVAIERVGSLAIMRMSKGRANAVDHTLLDDLIQACTELDSDDGVAGILFASAHTRVFCPGLDLVTTQSLSRDELAGFMLRFAEAIWTLFALEKPVVAALHGHTLAGGCVLALTADLRILAEPGVRMGLNEVAVGVPLPWTTCLLLQAAVSPAHLTHVALEGSNFTGAEAVKVGLAHELAPAASFEATCLERLAALADKESRAFAITKRFLREETLRRMKAGERERAQLFVDSWFSPGSQERIKRQIASIEK